MLVALCDSLERIVNDAHVSVPNDRINAFNLVLIDSLPSRGVDALGFEF